MSLGRNFTKAMVASGFANLADGVLWVALPLLAVRLTRSPLLIAGITVAARLPWLLAPVAGAFADRLDRRQSMVWVNLVRFVLLGGLALAVAGDIATLPMLYAVAVLLGMGETLFDTSAQSLLPAVVDRDGRGHGLHVGPARAAAHGPDVRPQADARRRRPLRVRAQVYSPGADGA